jgi:hypothetical protein
MAAEERWSLALVGFSLAEATLAGVVGNNVAVVFALAIAGFSVAAALTFSASMEDRLAAIAGSGATYVSPIVHLLACLIVGGVGVLFATSPQDMASSSFFQTTFYWSGIAAIAIVIPTAAIWGLALYFEINGIDRRKPVCEPAPTKAFPLLNLPALSLLGSLSGAAPGGGTPPADSRVDL